MNFPSKSQRKPKRSRRAGIFMLETLFTVSLCTMLMGMAAVLVFSGSQAYDQATDRAAQCRARANLASQFREDVRSADTATVEPSDNSADEPTAEQGGICGLPLLTLNYTDGRVVKYLEASDRSAVLRIESRDAKIVRRETYQTAHGGSTEVLNVAGFVTLRVCGKAVSSRPTELVAKIGGLRYDNENIILGAEPALTK